MTFPSPANHRAEYQRGCSGHHALARALDLFERRTDKEWGLTDCISFVVIGDHGLADAATGDRHFQQAGFRALMADPEP